MESISEGGQRATGAHPKGLRIQQELRFLGATTRLLGHFRYIPDEDPDKPVHRFCQGLSDQFEDLAQRVAKPGAAEDSEHFDICADLMGINAAIDAITHFNPEMKNGEFIDCTAGLFSEFFVYVGRRLFDVIGEWNSFCEVDQC